MPRYTLDPRLEDMLRWSNQVRGWLRAAGAALVMWCLFAGSAPAAEWTVAQPEEFPVWEAPEDPDEWTVVPGIHVDVHGRVTDYDLLLRLARYAATSLPQLATALDVPIGDRVQVYVADSEERFRALQPGKPPMWADGTAYPSLGVVFLKTPALRGGTAKPLTQVLDHELIHILLGRVFYPHRPPAWLQEGVAQVYAGETGPENTARLARGWISRDLMSLEELIHGFPQDPRAAELAYLQSADFILWLQERYGEEVVSVLVRDVAAGRPIRGTIRRITGRSFVDVDRIWRTRFTSGIPVWTGPLTEEIGWIAGALMLAVAGFRRRRRFRSRMAEMEEEELSLDLLVWTLLTEDAARSASLESSVSDCESLCPQRG